MIPFRATKTATYLEKEIMRNVSKITNRISNLRLHSLAALAGLVLLVLTQAQITLARESGSETFASAGEACRALHRAVQSNDDRALEKILGARKDVTSSGDAREDKLERQLFSRKYQEMHRLVKESNGSTVLYIGAENWPFPIPLVSKNGRWYFDSKAGTDEILFRRVGENETRAIEVCRALLRVEQQPTVGTDPITEYAQQLVGRNKTARAKFERQPFSGYYFRIPASRQAANAAPATYSRTATGSNRKDRVALVAYPAQYRSSGVMTFILTQDGRVYQKDLGPNTARLARNLKQWTALGWSLLRPAGNAGL